MLLAQARFSISSERLKKTFWTQSFSGEEKVIWYPVRQEEEASVLDVMVCPAPPPARPPASLYVYLPVRPSVRLSLPLSVVCVPLCPCAPVPVYP